jgi:hypothetical protein
MMMTLLQWSAWLMLMACGLWAGVILTFQVERINLWARMPIEQFAVDFRRSLFRVDPLQPILAALASIAGGYFAWFSLGMPRLLAWVGVALMVFVGRIYRYCRADQFAFSRSSRRSVTRWR